MLVIEWGHGGNSLKFICESDTLCKLKMPIQVHVEIAENCVVKYIRERSMDSV